MIVVIGKNIDCKKHELAKELREELSGMIYTPSVAFKQREISIGIQLTDDEKRKLFESDISDLLKSPGPRIPIIISGILRHTEYDFLKESSVENGRMIVFIEIIDPEIGAFEEWTFERKWDFTMYLVNSALPSEAVEELKHCLYVTNERIKRGERV